MQDEKRQLARASCDDGTEGLEFLCTRNGRGGIKIEGDEGGFLLNLHWLQPRSGLVCLPSHHSEKCLILFDYLFGGVFFYLLKTAKLSLVFGGFFICLFLLSVYLFVWWCFLLSTEDSKLIVSIWKFLYLFVFIVCLFICLVVFFAIYWRQQTYR